MGGSCQVRCFHEVPDRSTTLRHVKSAGRSTSSSSLMSITKITLLSGVQCVCVCVCVWVSVWVRACVRACVRAGVRACMRACVCVRLQFFIQAAGSHAAASNISALSPIRSGASSGSQSYDSDKSEYPMTESVPKLEIRAQVSHHIYLCSFSLVLLLTDWLSNRLAFNGIWFQCNVGTSEYSASSCSLFLFLLL